MSLLEVQNLSKTYGTRKSVDNISFWLNAGEVVGFLGPNGAGKTTTMRMIAGLIRPTSGNVNLLGKSVPGATLREMGAMIEEPSFYPYLSGRENLAYAAGMHGGISSTRISEVLEMVGLTARATDRVFKYSQGMRQRLGLARALLPSPKLLMLDEPANGLDPEGIAELREIIKTFGEQGISVLVSSHILSEVERFAPRILIINKGQLLRDSSLHTSTTSSNTEAELTYRIETEQGVQALELLKRESWVTRADLLPTGVRVVIPRSGAYRLAPLLVQAGISLTELSKESETSHAGDLEKLYLEVVGAQAQANQNGSVSHA
jgi:ABC-2 type transport system ATP-binding protein